MTLSSILTEPMGNEVQTHAVDAEWHLLYTGHRLNMELDSKVYLGSCVQLYSLAVTPQLHPLPPHWGSAHRGRYWSSQDRRHLFVTPWHRPIRNEVPLRLTQHRIIETFQFNTCDTTVCRMDWCKKPENKVQHTFINGHAPRDQCPYL